MGIVTSGERQVIDGDWNDFVPEKTAGVLLFILRYSSPTEFHS